jgi:ABC-2 type transport system permease protein
MDQSLPSSTAEARRAAGEEGFSLRRLGLVAGLDFRESLRRPLFLIWAALMAWNGWLISRGDWFFRSVDTSLGGPKAWVNSEFQITYVFALSTFFLLAFFVAVAAGTPLARDEELHVGPLLHSTPLRPGEYVWGKFLAALLASFAAVAVMPLTAAVFSRLLPDPSFPDIYGPFHLMSFLRPSLVFLLPAVVFTAGAAFAIGRFTGRPIVVFLLPIILFLFYNNFFWRYFPPTLSAEALAALRHLDPSGFRWLKENWLFVDRGLAFYNTRPVAFDLPFLLSRAGFALAGLLLVDLSRRHFAGSLRRTRARRAFVVHEEARSAAAALPPPLATLGMTSRAPGFLRGALSVARFELAELRSQPGLYIFVPAIALFMIVLYTGGYDNQYDGRLLTPGIAAMTGLLPLTTWLGLLFLFYTVESLERERTTGVGPVFYSTPARTSSLVAGKALALGVVAVVAVAVALLAAAYGIAKEGGVGMDLRPFLLVWGLLLPPTLILWTAFVGAVLVATRSRYGTYGVGLGAIVLTVFFFARDHMSWAGNWLLLGGGDGGSPVPWSDLGTFELDRAALALNRLLALALAVPLAWAAVRFFNRRERDRMRPALAPAERRRTLLTAAALAVVPLGLGLALWGQVNQGFQGGAIREKHKEYWRKNHATWLNQPQPYVTHVDMDLGFEPAQRAFRVAGTYDLQNRKERELDWFAVSGGAAWKGLSWTLDGRPWTPENREGLYVFRLPRPMAPGQSHRLGFRYSGTMLAGISRNGGDVPLGEFILPSGVILTGRNPDFVPVIGYVERLGVDEKNRYEPRIYPPRAYEGQTDADIDRSAFTQKIRITAPAEYTVNSTGVLTGSTEKDGRRTVVWESDYPLRVFNVAAGRWAVKRGQGTAVFYYPGHPWNVPSLLDALNGARRYYADWFGPYPWRELRLNEFPSLATYARGNATNIFFSEAAGFLALRTPEADPAFAIGAHEAAHQWWGHIMAPGEGPGGIVLAEGAANFSTLMLLQQMRGFQPRMRYATQMEANYGERRLPSTEKPLAETLSVAGRPGDETVVYDKGGWVLWMMLHQMGRDRFLAGARDFITTYHQSPDHPVIEDFVATMRPYAADKAAFDDFVRQWFFEIVIPEYHLDDPRKQPVGAGVWEVAVKVENAGTGRMPVEVAATQGRRFDEKGAVDPGFREARATVVLGAGESRQVRIRCPFEPERVTVDPDGWVLQLQRRAAMAKL